MPEERKIKHVVQVYQTPLYKNTIDTALRFGLERKQYAHMLLANCDGDVDFTQNLMGAFVWVGTPEGNRFWSDIHRKVAIPDAI